MKSNIQTCAHCNGKGKIEIETYLPASKMIKLMKKHALTQNSISKMLGISQSNVSHWLNKDLNTRGIKGKYFDVLKKKGYK